jgi:L-lactate dehydrogenase complex protein LldE
VSEPPPAVVQLFPTCLVDEMRPQVGIAAVELIEALCIRVEVPDGIGCCGQPAWNAGFADDARAVARQTIARLAATQGPIVIPSGSCADMLIHQSAELFRDDPVVAAQARVVASRCVEFTAFVAPLLDASPPPRAGPAPPVRTAYHASCHLSRGLGIGDPPVTLLRDAAGVEVVPLRGAEECCGFGGLFSVKQPELSGAMLDAKCRAIEASGAAVLASCDLGCLLHLEGGLRRRGSTVEVRHVAELLAAARRAPPAP